MNMWHNRSVVTNHTSHPSYMELVVNLNYINIERSHISCYLFFYVYGVWRPQPVSSRAPPTFSLSGCDQKYRERFKEEFNMSQNKSLFWLWPLRAKMSHCTDTRPHHCSTARSFSAGGQKKHDFQLLSCFSTLFQVCFEPGDWFQFITDSRRPPGSHLLYRLFNLWLFNWVLAWSALGSWRPRKFKHCWIIWVSRYCS